MKERAGIQSVEVGFTLLEVLAKADGPLMLRDLAASANMSAAKAHRLLVEKVRQTLAQHPEHSRNADDLATWLNMSARTLHRQLKEEGATLQQLKDAVRREVAIQQLQRTSRAIKQIAQAAGFQNEKSFIRAFKGWTGQSPEAFRQQQR